MTHFIVTYNRRALHGQVLWKIVDECKALFGGGDFDPMCNMQQMAFSIDTDSYSEISKRLKDAGFQVEILDY